MIKDLLKQPYVIILFTAPFCAPCHPMNDLLTELLENEDAIQYAKLDVLEERAFAQSLGVRSLPNVTFFHNGKPVLNIIGAKSRLEYSSKIDWFLGL